MINNYINNNKNNNSSNKNYKVKKNESPIKVSKNKYIEESHAVALDDFKKLLASIDEKIDNF